LLMEYREHTGWEYIVLELANRTVMTWTCLYRVSSM
jgi:hypothetical protein